MPASPQHGSDSPSDSLFAGWLARRNAGEAADFEALCREHPTHAQRLREYHAQWQSIADLERRFGLAGSIAERLSSRFGSQIDPKVQLGGEDAAEGDFTSKLLGRLSGRASASSRYRLKGEVACGGMGAILRVWDEDLRRNLAMKVMLGKGGSPTQGGTPPVDQRVLARFLEEAQVTGQLDHPGIVPVHELGLDAEGRVYFTMKLVKGRDLKTIFDQVHEQKEGWSQVKALGVLLKVCEAMSYAHDKGVIHRDLKPANVMVGRYGEVYVMDWGLAKILGREDEKDIRIRAQGSTSLSEVRSDRREHAGEMPDSPLYTMDGDVVGTPAYMPPEQAAGRTEAMGPQADVYAVGAMLYHLIAGHMPYVRPGAKASNYMVLRWVQEAPPKPLHREAPLASAELVAICEKAMDRHPNRRYRDMSELAKDLSAFMEGRVVRALRTGLWGRARKWLRRNRLLALAIAALLAVGALLLPAFVGLLFALMIGLDFRVPEFVSLELFESTYEDELRLLSDFAERWTVEDEAAAQEALGSMIERPEIARVEITEQDTVLFLQVSKTQSNQARWMGKPPGSGGSAFWGHHEMSSRELTDEEGDSLRLVLMQGIPFLRYRTTLPSGPEIELTVDFQTSDLNPVAHLNKGRSLLEVDDFLGAIEEFRTAVRLDERDPRHSTALATALRAHLDQIHEDPSPSPDHDEHSCSRLHVEELLALARARHYEGDAEEAREMLSKARAHAIDLGDPSITDQLAVLERLIR